MWRKIKRFCICGNFFLLVLGVSVSCGVSIKEFKYSQKEKSQNQEHDRPSDSDIYNINRETDKGSLNRNDMPDMQCNIGETRENRYFNNADISKKYENIHIKVYKKMRALELYAGEELLGRYKIALGMSPEGHKQKEGDSKTPEGRYYVCTRNENSKFTRFLGISYPSFEDAKRGFEQKLISESTYKTIAWEISLQKRPPWDTPLGGAVGIHGGGNASDWTQGCIALSDEDIMILWALVPIKAEVEILP